MFLALPADAGGSPAGSAQHVARHRCCFSAEVSSPLAGQNCRQKDTSGDFLLSPLPRLQGGRGDASAKLPCRFEADGVATSITARSASLATACGDLYQRWQASNFAHLDWEGTVISAVARPCRALRLHTPSRWLNGQMSTASRGSTPVVGWRRRGVGCLRRLDNRGRRSDRAASRSDVPTREFLSKIAAKHAELHGRRPKNACSDWRHLSWAGPWRPRPRHWMRVIDLKRWPGAG